MTLAIAHHDDGHPVLDAVREVKAPFAPDPVVKEFGASNVVRRSAIGNGETSDGESFLRRVWQSIKLAVHGGESKLRVQSPGTRSVPGILGIVVSYRRPL